MRGIQFRPTMLAVALAAVMSFAGDAIAQFREPLTPSLAARESIAKRI